MNDIRIAYAAADLTSYAVKINCGHPLADFYGKEIEARLRDIADAFGFDIVKRQPEFVAEGADLDQITVGAA